MTYDYEGRPLPPPPPPEPKRVATFTCHPHRPAPNAWLNPVIYEDVIDWRPEYGCYLLILKTGTAVAIAISSFESIHITTKEVT